MILAKMRAFEAAHGPEFAPSPLLVRLAEEGGSCGGYDRSRAGR